MVIVFILAELKIYTFIFFVLYNSSFKLNAWVVKENVIQVNINNLELLQKN